jgi:hypothetical protein
VSTNFFQTSKKKQKTKKKEEEKKEIKNINLQTQDTKRIKNKFKVHQPCDNILYVFLVCF